MKGIEFSAVPPTELKITDGKITTSTGDEPTEYLKEFQDNQKLPAESFVNIVAHDRLKTIMNQSNRYLENLLEAKCGWCFRTYDKVGVLVEGVGTYICDECVDICAELVAERKAKL